MFDDSYEDDDLDEDGLDEITDFENLLRDALKSMMRSGNVDELRVLGKPGIGARSPMWETVWRSAVKVACERGQVDALAYSARRMRCTSRRAVSILRRH